MVKLPTCLAARSASLCLLRANHRGVLLHTAQHTCDLQPVCMVKLLVCHAAQSAPLCLLRAKSQRRWMQKPTVCRAVTLQEYWAAKQQAHICSLSFWESSPVSEIAFVHGKYQPLLCSYNATQCDVWLHWPMSSALQMRVSSTQAVAFARCWVLVRLCVTAEVLT